MSADDGPRTARLIHHTLVGDRIGIVPVEAEQIELLGWFGLCRDGLGETWMTLLLLAIVVAPRFKTVPTKLKAALPSRILRGSTITSPRRCRCARSAPFPTH